MMMEARTMGRTTIGVLCLGLAWLVPAVATAQTEQVYTYHTDAVGSVRMITDANGQEVTRYDFWPFGQVSGSPAVQDSRMFVGEEHDGESGFDYFGARHYASGTGRFTTVDPVLDFDAALVDPQQWNRYAYARNNPFAYIDPAGAAIELLGDDEARKQELDLMRKAIGSMAGQRLYINTVGEGKDARYFVGIQGDVGDFMRLGDAAHNLANLVVHQSVVEFGLTGENLAGWGGAVTLEPGERGNSNTRVLVNPAQLNFANARLSPATLLGSIRFEGQAANPPWTVNPINAEIATWHEFGHAWGVINGRGMRRTNPEALDWENQMRAVVYGPLGPLNARRIGH
jgi:RHS repeat-associated protein